VQRETPLLLPDATTNLTEQEWLAARTQQLEQQNHAYKTFDYFDAVMQWQDNQTLGSWSHHVLMKLCIFLQAYQGVLYYVNSQKQQLVLGATFAVNDPDKLQNTIQVGAGLLGAACLSQHRQLLPYPAQQFTVSSGLRTQPACILVLPLVYNRKTIGVTEIVFVNTPSQEILNFLDQLAPRIAGNLNALVKEEILQQTLQRVQESEARLQQMAAVTTEGILFVEGKRIIEVNVAFLNLVGYQAQEVLNESLDKFFKKSILSQLYETYIEAELSCKYAVECHVAINTTEMVIKKNKVRVLRVRDITEQKLAEQQIALQHQQLEEANRIVELLKIIEAKNEDITTSIRYAQRIQRALLPQRSQLQGFFEDYFMLYHPRDIVSGDFYWLQPLQNQQVMLALGDCTGHGVPAAFMSMLGIATLNHITLQKNIYTPNEILSELRKDIYYLLKQDETESREGMDLALCRIDYKTQKLQFAGAKNDLVYFQHQTMHLLKGSKGYIGGTISQVPFDLHEFEINTPTVLYLFSDGYRDQIGGARKRKLGSSPFRQLLQDIHEKNCREQQLFLEDFFKDWLAKGQETQLDDVTVLGVKLLTDKIV